MKQILILFIAFILLSTISVQSEIIAVRVSPDNVTLAPGQTYRFTAQGIDSFFGNMNIQPIWVVEGQGRITPDGVYIAGHNINGMDVVKAIYPGRRIHGVARVFIRFNHATPYPPNPGYTHPRPPHPGYIPPTPKPPHPGYIPPKPKPSHPGYIPPKPGYNPPSPGYNQPKPPHPGYNQPKPPHPGYNQPKPIFNQPRPGYNQPRPGYNQPNPGYDPRRPNYNK